MPLVAPESAIVEAPPVDVAWVLTGERRWAGQAALAR